MVRFLVLSSGHVVELDDPDGDPKLIGKLSWPSCPFTPARDVFPDQGGTPPSWPEGDWIPLILDGHHSGDPSHRAAALN
jgi:hypothetical protein